MEHRVGQKYKIMASERYLERLKNMGIHKSSWENAIIKVTHVSNNKNMVKGTSMIGEITCPPQWFTVRNWIWKNSFCGKSKEV